MKRWQKGNHLKRPYDQVETGEQLRGRRGKHKPWLSNESGLEGQPRAKRGRTGSNTIDVDWSPPLPPGWNEELDEESNCSYYWHDDDPESTTWEHPAFRMKEGPSSQPIRVVTSRRPIHESAADMQVALEPVLEWAASDVATFLLDVGLVTAAEAATDCREMDKGLIECRVLVLAICEFGGLSDGAQRQVTNACKRFLGVDTCTSTESADTSFSARAEFLEVSMEQWTITHAAAFLDDVGLGSAAAAAKETHQPGGCTISCKALVLAVLETSVLCHGKTIYARGKIPVKKQEKKKRKCVLTEILSRYVQVVQSSRKQTVHSVKPPVRRWSCRDAVSFLHDAGLEGAATAARYGRGIVFGDVLALAVSGVDHFNPREHGSAISTCQQCLELSGDNRTFSKVNQCVERWSSRKVADFLDGAGMNNAAAAASQCDGHMCGTTSCQALVLAILHFARSSKREREVAVQACKAVCKD